MIAAVITFTIIASGPMGHQSASAIRDRLTASAPCLVETYSPQAARLHIHVRTATASLGVQAYWQNIQTYSEGSYHIEAIALLDGRPVARAAASSTQTTVWVNMGFLTLRLPLGRPDQAVDSVAQQLAAQLRYLCQAPVPEQDQGPAS